MPQSKIRRGASHNLKSHSTKSGRYLSSHLANRHRLSKTSSAESSTICDYGLGTSECPIVICIFVQLGFLSSSVMSVRR